MNRTLYIALSILLIFFVILGILFFFKSTGTTQSPSSGNSNSSAEFPIDNSKTGNTASSNANTLMSVAAQNGGEIATVDFIHNGVTTEDPENQGNYYLAGSVGYCLKNGSCPSGASSTEYHIVYFSDSKSFIISLITEPIGQARLDAEQFLMKTLGITEQEMCNLNYSVLTTASVNSTYAGQNLGFSFCPGAVALPQ